MNSFARVLRIPLGYRPTIVAVIGCSLIVALLWGGNITAVYPLVKVVLNGKSACQWIDEEIASTQTRVAKIKAGGELTSRQQTQLHAEQRALDLYHRFRPGIEKYAPATPFGTLVGVCLFLVIGTLVKNLFRIAGQILTARLAHKSVLQLRNEFYRRTLSLDLARFNDEGRGDLMNRFTTDLALITSGIQTAFGMAVREPLKMVACLAGAAFVSWRLLLLTLVIAPLAAITVAWLAKALKRAHRSALSELSGIYETLGETFAGMKLIKAFTMEPYEQRRFADSSQKYYRQSMKIARYDSLTSPVTETMGITMTALAILAGGYLAINEQNYLFGFIKISDRPLDAGGLMLFFGFLAGVSDPARRLSGVFNSLQQAAAASDRLYEMFDRQPVIDDPPQAVPLPERLGPIRFENVSFAYHPEQPILENIDLTVEPGETIAIVGPNGCGKTTLLSLIPRFIDPTAGCVRFGDVDVRSARVRDVRSRIGLVSQETLLFNDTVAANIRYGVTNATDEQVVEAASKAQRAQIHSRQARPAVRNDRGAGGKPPLRGTAATHRPRQGHPPRSGNPPARRGHQSGGCRE